MLNSEFCVLLYPMKTLFSTSRRAILIISHQSSSHQHFFNNPKSLKAYVVEQFAEKNNKKTSKILSPAKLCRGTHQKKETLPKTDKFHICLCGKLSTPLLLPTNVGAKPWEVDQKSKKRVTLLGGSSPWKSLSPFKTWQGSFLMMINPYLKNGGS